MRRGRSIIGLVALSLLVGGACGPTQPSVSDRVTLVSVRYVRTRPVVATAAIVSLQYSIARPEDPFRRPSIGAVSQRAVDDLTFVYDYPQNFSVPVDQECTFYVEDLAVSPYYLATDIYVNDTRIRVEKAGNYEYGRFKVDTNGRVY